MTTGERLLASIRSERGYTLSFHEVLARIDPAYLAAYADFYRAITLTERHLSPAERECVWITLLVAAREEVGTIHVERAETAGVTRGRIDAFVTLAAVADAWEALEFVAEAWDRADAGAGSSAYQALIEAAAAGADPTTVDLALLAAQGARRRRQPFLIHLRRLIERGTPEGAILEALTYIQQPCGANSLLWATDLWLDALRSGEIPPSPVLGTGDFPTRRQ